LANLLCAISVDLDEIPNYYSIHGLSLPPACPGMDAVYDVALNRLEHWSRARHLPLTLFAIGSDLGRRANADRLRGLVGAGHEVANHTLDHLYDLTRRGRDEMRHQIEGGAAAIERATGTRPRGFRAPGYTVTDELFSVLEEVGVAYDSSVFPCPSYYLAKVAKIALIRVAGRRSLSVRDTPNVLLAPTAPYRIGSPYWRRGGGLLEAPIQVTRGPRLPFIGTTLTLAGPTFARYMAKLVAGAPFVNLELHGIDVLDTTDGFPELREHQPDAGIPHARKLEALDAAVEELRRAGYAFVRLDEAVRAFG
jgi:peptidoglycan/xylan/chitin deacetylase (PgdA/CDA1 family)